MPAGKPGGSSLAPVRSTVTFSPASVDQETCALPTTPTLGSSMGTSNSRAFRPEACGS
jgi:hypothetical protein